MAQKKEDYKTVLKYLWKDYRYEYCFTESELAKYGFRRELLGLKIPENPIIFESAEKGFYGLRVIAFGACIGRIPFSENINLPYDSKMIDELKKLLQYLDKTVDGHNNRIYLPKSFCEKYISATYKGRVAEKLEKALKEKSINEVMMDDDFLNHLVCAAYVRYMRRSKNNMVDFSERSIQSLIARHSLDKQINKQIVIDVEYKIKLSKKIPSVDFVVLDLSDRSLGLIEFKYQGQSMNPKDKNSLTEHLLDFQEMIDTKAQTIKDDMASQVMHLLSAGVIKAKDINVEKGKDISGDFFSKIWCGFYFVESFNDENGNPFESSRRSDGKRVSIYAFVYTWRYKALYRIWCNVFCIMLISGEEKHEWYSGKNKKTSSSFKQ